MTAPPLREVARVTARDGRSVILPDGGWLVIGRDEACALAFPAETRLSRRAVHVEWAGSGVLITNLSGVHGLVVEADGAVSRVPSGSSGGVLTRHRAEITGPAWGGSTFGLTVVVSGAPAPAVPAVVVTTEATEAAEPVRLDTRAEEFLTALVLCRDRLRDPARAALPPPVPELTRQILEATHSWHLVAELDADPRARTRLTGRVHEHLKALRSTMVRGGLASRDVRSTPTEMVDLLVASGAVTPEHLRLFDDASWLADHEAQWWGA